VSYYSCSAGAYYSGVEIGVMHYPITGRSPCTCNTGSTSPFFGKKEYKCQ
jgi:hypothetical protein